MGSSASITTPLNLGVMMGRTYTVETLDKKPLYTGFLRGISHAIRLDAVGHGQATTALNFSHVIVTGAVLPYINADPPATIAATPSNSAAAPIIPAAAASAVAAATAVNPVTAAVTAAKAGVDKATDAATGVLNNLTAVANQATNSVNNAANSASQMLTTDAAPKIIKAINPIPAYVYPPSVKRPG